MREANSSQVKSMFPSFNNKPIKRLSWDTSVKHFYRLGLEGTLPLNFKQKISRSNISRWKQEPANKYIGNEILDVIQKDLELYKSIGEIKHLKLINQKYVLILNTFHDLIADVKGVKSIIKKNKICVVNTIEAVKDYIPIEQALKVFNISRTTYQNYKTLVIHKCESSYFKWCTKRFSNQLLSSEVEIIKKYMTHPDYMFWSKPSIYLKGVRDNSISCCESTFYKYCNLLGFKNRRFKSKADGYSPKTTTKPNELWCADVTIFKTADGKKHYIHILMDHYSRMILGYRIENSNSGKAIRDLIKSAREKHKSSHIHLLTDGGSENVNQYVSEYLNSLDINWYHDIAQKDVIYSNSMIEALNKVIKQQFLYPKIINSRKQLEKILNEAVLIYNTIRPQKALKGNTPIETFNGQPHNLKLYKSYFKTQKPEFDVIKASFKYRKSRIFSILKC